MLRKGRYILYTNHFQGNIHLYILIKLQVNNLYFRVQYIYNKNHDMVNIHLLKYKNIYYKLSTNRFRIQHKYYKEQYKYHIYLHDLKTFLYIYM